MPGPRDSQLRAGNIERLARGLLEQGEPAVEMFGFNREKQMNGKWMARIA